MAKKPNKVYNNWGGIRPGAGRPSLDLDEQTRKHYVSYNMQRLHAGYRGIDWQFTFETWLEWWGEDIQHRGQGSGKLVMARNGDQGPYHPDNVRKITHNENTKEMHYVHRGKRISAENIIFNSLTEAAKHFGMTVEGIRSRTKSRPKEYYYIKELECKNT